LPSVHIACDVVALLAFYKFVILKINSTSVKNILAAKAILIIGFFRDSVSLWTRISGTLMNRRLTMLEFVRKHFTKPSQAESRGGMKPGITGAITVVCL